jgi:hypothetical protein
MSGIRKFRQVHKQSHYQYRVEVADLKVKLVKKDKVVAVEEY